MFDLWIIKGSYGDVLINPIGDNLFIPNEIYTRKMQQAQIDYLLTGEAYVTFEIKKKEV